MQLITCNHFVKQEKIQNCKCLRLINVNKFRVTIIPIHSLYLCIIQQRYNFFCETSQNKLNKAKTSIIFLYFKQWHHKDITNTNISLIHTYSIYICLQFTHIQTRYMEKMVHNDSFKPEVPPPSTSITAEVTQQPHLLP